jgi:hypothetical protein
MKNTTPAGNVKSTSKMMSGISKAMCLALAVAAIPYVGIFTVQPAYAQSIDQLLYNSSEARVNRSARLRSLTEAVASASCRVNGEIGTETAQAALTSSSEDFERIIDGLLNGSPALGMPGPEQRARTLNTLRDTATLWKPLNAAAKKLASGAGTSTDAATISDGVATLFEQAELLAAVVTGQYTDPSQVLQRDATVLNFAVRQRALAYRMTRAMCELATDTGSAGTLEELTTTIDLFQQTLIALRDGFPGAGISPPPSDAVRSSLNATYQLWQEQRGIFDTALAKQTPSADNVMDAASLSKALSVAMDNAITLYLIATPGQVGVYRVPLEAYARESWPCG